MAHNQLESCSGRKESQILKTSRERGRRFQIALLSLDLSFYYISTSCWLEKLPEPPNKFRLPAEQAYQRLLTTKSQQLFIVLSRVFLLSSKASTVLNCTRGREIKIRRANETRVVRSTNRKLNKVAQNDTRVSRNDNQLSKHDNTIWMKRWFVFQFSSRPFP